MGYSQHDPVMQCRPAWNAGKSVGTKRPLTQKQIWAVRFFLDREGRLRDRALFDLAIDSKLRGCDLVKIKIADLVSGNLWNADDVIAMLDRHPSVKIWLDGHNHEGNYGERNGIHYVNLKAMLDTEENAYSRLDFFDDRIELHGVGRQESRVLRLRAMDRNRSQVPGARIGRE